ncbi:MAG: AAA family ATPase [Cyclobacteriaceae bacterium]|nr:MAG: AAA family ATPase [Cyclobacteriaceae bacterium]
MTRALVIGKFMPIHKGHVALIEFAATQADEVIVSMSFTPNDTIGPQLRFSWIKEIFKDSPNIVPSIIKDDFDDESIPLAGRTNVWAATMRQVYPKIDIVVSSEAYGDPFAINLNATHISFDPKRSKVPVSASLIRAKPFQYWDFIPAVVRPYFVKKICFYGSESTGKSFMAQKMAKRYQTEFVPEVARELITSNDFTEADIIKIGYAQIERINEKIKTANKILFCDTDTITTQIYSRHYLHTVPAVLFELEKQVQYDQYFLFDIDVPWVADHMRDLGNERVKMFQVFKNELDQRAISYRLVTGNYQQREIMISKCIDEILAK